MNKLKSVEANKWATENIEDLLSRYGFDLNEALLDFDEDTANNIATFRQFCQSMYNQYIDDKEYDESKAQKHIDRITYNGNL